MSRRFRFADAEGVGSGGGGSDRGILLLTPKGQSSCYVYKPSWFETRTVFRILPGRNPENPAEFDQFQLSEEPGDFGDWIRPYPAVYRLGEPGITFIYHDPRDDSVDVQQYPVWVFGPAIKAAAKAQQALPSWGPLLATDVLDRKKPTTLYVVQAILFEHKSQRKNPPIGAPGGKTCVIYMTKSAGEALRDAVISAGVDIVDPNAGAFVSLFQAPSTGPNEGGNKYACQLLADYHGMSPSLQNFPGWENQVLPWDQIIKVMSVEEQVRLLCQCGYPESAMVYALQPRYEEYIPKSALEKAYMESGGRFGRPPEGMTAAPTVVPSTQPTQPMAPAWQQPAAPQMPTGQTIGQPINQPIQPPAPGPQSQQLQRPATQPGQSVSQPGQPLQQATPPAPEPAAPTGAPTTTVESQVAESPPFPVEQETQAAAPAEQPAAAQAPVEQAPESQLTAESLQSVLDRIRSQSNPRQ